MDKRVTGNVRTHNRFLLAFLVIFYAIPLVLFVEEFLGIAVYSYNYIVTIGIAMGLAVITDRIYVSIQNNKTNNGASQSKPFTTFNKDMHKFGIILLVAVYPLRLPLYFTDHPEWSGITSVDIWLFIAFITIIALDRLYNNNYMYLYSALLAISLSVYFATLLNKSINSESVIDALKYLFIIVLAIPIILLLYDIPIKVIKKHNKAINHDAQ